jgi:hypothetical protein
MSDRRPLQFSVPCEGPSDLAVIEAILEALLGERPVVTLLQPEPDPLSGGGFGELGSGWKGVRSWCEQVARDYGSVGGLVSLLPDARPVALIIHLDADVADEREVDCARPCPPASETADALRDVLLGWAGERAVPEGVVLCTPSKSTEAWVLAALYPAHELVGPDLECEDEPARPLVNRPEKLVRRRSGRYQKSASAYYAVARRITEAWPHVCEVCTQAQRFSDELAACVRQ